MRNITIKFNKEDGFILGNNKCYIQELYIYDEKTNLFHRIHRIDKTYLSDIMIVQNDYFNKSIKNIQIIKLKKDFYGTYYKLIIPKSMLDIEDKNRYLVQYKGYPFYNSDNRYYYADIYKTKNFAVIETDREFLNLVSKKIEEYRKILKDSCCFSVSKSKEILDELNMKYKEIIKAEKQEQKIVDKFKNKDLFLYRIE